MCARNHVVSMAIALLVSTGCATANEGGSADAALPGPVDAAMPSADAGCGDLCDADEDGVPDGIDECPGTPAGETVNQEGCAESQIIPTIVEEFPPFGLTWVDNGELGVTGGLTWTYTAIQRGDLFHIYWILCDDPATPCGVGLDGGLDTAEEYFQYSDADSDAVNGVLVFTSTPQIMLADGSTPTLNARLTVTVTDLNDAPQPGGDAVTLGVATRSGKAGVEITGTAFRVHMIAEIEDGAVWTPYREYFDAAPTPDGAQVIGSVSGFFYSE